MPRFHLCRYFFSAIFIGAIFSPPTAFHSNASAQEIASNWDAFFERRDGWLAADGIYSIDLTRDAADVCDDSSSSSATETPRKELFWFSDTFGGSTRFDGREFDRIQMTNHSFAQLDGLDPRPENSAFFWRRDTRASNGASNGGDFGESDDEKARNLLGVERWLQDGLVYRGRIWLSALLVDAKTWKPSRVDAVSLGLDADGTPDFNDVRVDENAPLSFETQKMQVVFGAAICDDFSETGADQTSENAESTANGDDFLYVFGYLDRFDAGSRKDLVVARAPRDRFDEFATWRFFDGRDWSPNVADACRPEAGLVENVSTEFSISKIEFGANAGKFLLVYTPGVISDKLAFRIGDSPTGPFGPENVFYRSPIPREFAPGVRCYNAKAHPIFGDSSKILVSYNVNRLGSLPRTPAEYRPRFVWLEYRTLDGATNDSKQPSQPGRDPEN